MVVRATAIRSGVHGRGQGGCCVGRSGPGTGVGWVGCGAVWTGHRCWLGRARAWAWPGQGASAAWAGRKRGLGRAQARLVLGAGVTGRARRARTRAGAGWSNWGQGRVQRRARERPGWGLGATCLGCRCVLGWDASFA